MPLALERPHLKSLQITTVSSCTGMKTPAGMGSEAGLPSEYVRCVLSLANRETRQLLGVYQCDDLSPLRAFCLFSLNLFTIKMVIFPP